MTKNKEKVQHFCPLRVRLVIISLALVVPSSILVVAWFQPVHPPSFFTRDALAVARSINAQGEWCCSRFIGAISLAGIMIWSAAAAIAATAALLLKSLGAPRNEVVLFTLVSSLTAWLAADDALMLHEGYSPKLFGLSLTHLVPVIGILPIIALLVRARIWADIPILIFALTALGTSIAIDDIIAGEDTAIFIEDSFKFVGIFFWAAFFLLTAIESVLRAVAISDRDPGEAILAVRRQKRGPI